MSAAAEARTTAPVQVRTVEEADVPHLLRLFRTFHQESPFSDEPYNPRSVGDTLGHCMDEKFPDRVAFVAELDGEAVGAAGAVMQHVWFDYSTFYAIEAFWFVAPRFRGQGIGTALAFAMEGWAKGKGCKYLVLSSFGDRVPLDYERCETTYRRML
ncbi:GNAT family N-acetyltransferase [Lentisalinibacter orientalis]|uniref:GNAT family N-acetyltransferase n=1 Tax=Lentisalinibacter orientalis TaxID=2992241 RepID=UPI00386BEF8F